MDGADSLPDDLAACQRLLLAERERCSALAQRTCELERVLDATSASFDELQESHAAALAVIEQLQRWIYGRRRERIVEGAGQGHLFELESVGEGSAPPEPEARAAEPAPAPRPQRRRRRELDLDKLPHYRHEHDLPEAEKTCACCGRAKDRIGQDQSKVLDYVPAKLEVHVHVRPKYACRYCKNGVASPPPPERPIARGIAGPGLVAQIVVAKFGDHLPLYRQEDVFARAGLHVARSTQCDWVRAAADLLQPLYERQKELVLQSPVLWTDDTPVTVLTREASRQGRFWVYIAQEHPYSVYDFTQSRQRDGPAKFLANFAGYLHADAYSGYDHIYLGSNASIIEVACWAHARRKFFDARTSAPRDAHQMLELVRQLYDVEDRARELSPSARQKLRAAEADPVLDRIEAHLAELADRALPKSPLGQAVAYARNQWPALRRYTDDGRLSIDNNVSERTLRQQAIGRKNWMFLGAAEAGERAAVLFTVLAGAKRHRLEPWAYVSELLLRLHADDGRLDEMLPDAYAAAHPEAILDYRLQEQRRKAAAVRQRRARRRAANRRK